MRKVHSLVLKLHYTSFFGCAAAHTKEKNPRISKPFRAQCNDADESALNCRQCIIHRVENEILDIFLVFK